MPQYIAAIDQGTTSTRCMVFDRAGRVVASDQKEHRQIYPKPGWVEHDPAEIWTSIESVVAGALRGASLRAGALAAVGVANQRETTIVWDRRSGKAVYNAIVWQDTRTDSICRRLAGDFGSDRFRAKTGLPITTYFSGPKLKWLLDNVAGLRERAEGGEVLFGTVDSWILWNLTGEHYTDVTNASRTLLMNVHTLDWDDEMLIALGIPRAMLPRIGPSSAVIGTARAGCALSEVVVAGDLGDQQAALFGQTCFSPGEAKNTYGTGCFMLLNTGEKPVASNSGLLTTLAYKIRDEKPAYALEGSVAIAGALVQWLRDNLGIIGHSDEVETLARTVEDNGGVYFVPAFSGLFAPHWRADARGAILGMTRHTNKGHIARASLEATAFQTLEILEAMEKDSGVRLTELKVDGGMVVNELLMQFQADLLNVPVVRPQVAETTALGAAYAAGLAVGYWKDLDELRLNWRQEAKWLPRAHAAQREKMYSAWKKAVSRTLDWVA
ncbi:MAG: glycerol kinase GlpK [Chloroflexota bacterium]